MKVFISKSPGRIFLQVVAVGPDAVGDCQAEVTPGRSALGKTYEEWAAIDAPSVELD